ncbi:D-Ala-D-Ala carboxypeptidase family metallohydrolase [Mesonia sp.]|uniref:YcbK family protein n=1 Tax=Mesonia sp. TaxID=1960830 RepID=UPI00176DD483|nr:D-Ala-D-Ala carboxypeptidase family metallohydrolase [Mesonia sp.]HIB37975.1 DUF882 domain-containing protein [Mesonia sp.]HIO26609.1 DUF882 domain-containing protein [Flavobacteriaceae bacterium]
MELTKNFDTHEFESKDGLSTPKNLMPNIQELADNLQVLRDYFGLPISINSGYRSPSHNRSIGGVKNSQHVQGKAADITVSGKSPKEVHQAIERLIAEGKMKQGGLGLYSTFVHYDIRGTKARWNG